MRPWRALTIDWYTLSLLEHERELELEHQAQIEQQGKADAKEKPHYAFFFFVQQFVRFFFLQFI